MCRTLITIIALVMGLLAGTDYAAAGTDWNVWTVKGRVTSVYREFDSGGSVVESRVTVATGSETITAICSPTDADCDFPLTDPCPTTSVSVGAIDFVDHTSAQETCTSGAGKCLYLNGMLVVDPSNGNLNAVAATTTVMALGDCTAR